MIKHEISLNDPQGLDKALLRVMMTYEKLEAIAREITEALAVEGVRLANINFTDAEYAGTKNIDTIDFKLSDDGKSATVFADGESVLFIEFGTGILRRDAYEERQDIVESNDLWSHGMYKGRRSHGMSIHGWFYPAYRGDGGEHRPGGTSKSYKKSTMLHTYGNDANSSMWEARHTLELRYAGIVLKAFKKYGG